MADLFVQGRIVGFIFLVFFMAVAYYMARIADRWNPTIREIPAIQAIQEAVGRATELGRPVHFTTGVGLASLDKAEDGPQIMAGLFVFSYLSRLCAKNRVKLIVSVGQPDTMPLLEEYVRLAYQAENLPVPNMSDTLRFLTTEQFAFITGATGIMRRERPAANICVGPFWAESAQLVASANQAGALQVIGTARPSQIFWFAIFSDYMLIGEEIYAAGAQLSKDKETLNTLAAQDVGKLAAIALSIVGAILAIAGSQWLVNLFGV